MKDPLIVGVGTKYSGYGYGQLAMQHNLEYELIHVKSSKLNLRKAVQCVFYCKTCGWVETDKSPFKDKIKRFTCIKCKWNYENQVDECTRCGGKVKDSSFEALVFELKKTGVLSNHHAMLMLEEKSKYIYETIIQDREYQKTTDELIHTSYDVIKK